MNQSEMPTPGNTSAMTGEGRLIFRVTTARGAIPLEGARIRIWDRAPGLEPDPDRTNARAVLYSDRNGKTEPIALPAPARSLSLEPSGDNAPSPFSCYDAEVYLENYYTMSYVCIPIFDGITSIQPADLIPLPENGRPDGVTPNDTRVVEGENPDL